MRMRVGEFVFWLSCLGGVLKKINDALEESTNDSKENSNTWNKKPA
jgi:hypothetical protein